MRARLQEEAITEGMKKLESWELRGNALFRRMQFKDFKQAFAFMGKVSEAAEQLNHHPDWRNVYNVLEISLSTHDAGGITALDMKLAEEIDKLSHGF